MTWTKRKCISVGRSVSNYEAEVIFKISFNVCSYVKGIDEVVRVYKRVLKIGKLHFKYILLYVFTKNNSKVFTYVDTRVWESFISYKGSEVLQGSTGKGQLWEGRSCDPLGDMVIKRCHLTKTDRTFKYIYLTMEYIREYIPKKVSYITKL